MVTIVELETFTPTGWEIVPYSKPFTQEVVEFRDSRPIDATPISSYAREQLHGAIEEGNGSSRKRRRYTSAEVMSEIEKDFTLAELYKSENVEEIIEHIQQDLTTIIDPEVFLQNLKGWTVETTKRPHGKLDKFYRHPVSRKKLRSLKEVKKIIEDKSRKSSSNNGEGSEDAVAERFNENTYSPIPRGQPESVGSRPSVIGDNVYLEQFEVLKRALSGTISNLERSNEPY